MLNEFLFYLSAMERKILALKKIYERKFDNKKKKLFHH